MEPPVTKVYFYIPVARSPNARMVRSFEEARVQAAILKEAEFTTADWDYSGHTIEAKRNRAAGRFLKTECEYVLMVDDDMDFEPDLDAIAKLLVCAREEKADIVGPLMVRRAPPHDVAFNEVRFKPDQMQDVLSYATRGMRVPIQGHIGTGCLLIHRRVFEGLSAPWFDTTSSSDCQVCNAGELNGVKADPSCGRCGGKRKDPDGCWTRIGEDANFCHRAIDAGFRCILEAAVTVGHLGDQSFTFEDTVLAKNPLEFADALIRKHREPKAVPAEIHIPGGELCPR